MDGTSSRLANTSRAERQSDAMDRVLQPLLGRTFDSATFDRQTGEWSFAFDGAVVLRVSAPWRVAVHDCIVLGGEDHGHAFGLPGPVDAFAHLTAHLGGKRVVAAFASATADVAIDFGDGARLEVFNASAGYEGWQLDGPGERWIVGQGGGTLAESR
jgi:hypothetical protein